MKIRRREPKFPNCRSVGDPQAAQCHQAPVLAAEENSPARRDIDIRSFSSFKKGFHHVPDHVSSATQNFVSKEEIDKEMNEVFACDSRCEWHPRS